jgi:hypothetical protein
VGIVESLLYVGDFLDAKTLESTSLPTCLCTALEEDPDGLGFVFGLALALWRFF